MANISKITTPDGNTYDLRDATSSDIVRALDRLNTTLTRPDDIASLSDVNITNPSDEDIIRYSSTREQWENTALTASDIPYSQGVSVADKLDSVKIIKTGSAYYSNLKGGGWADKVTVTITFDTPMPNANYVAFTMINDAYNDFPFIRIFPFSRSTTGFTATCINQSGSTKAVGGSFDWVVIG